MVLKVEVTKGYISLGVRGSCRTCPVALAVLAALPIGSPMSVAVTPHALGLIYTPSYRMFVLTLPEVATRFIDDFDGGLPVSPFSFEVDVPGLESVLTAA